MPTTASPPSSTNKAVLRRQLLALRTALAPEERARQNLAIHRRFFELPLFHSARAILGYYPTASEVDALPILVEAHRAGKHVALPRVDGNALRLHRWVPGDPLERGSLGIQEPLPRAEGEEDDAVDVVLVPGVGFDRSGHRLGMGRGFYDRLLPRLGGAQRVGLAFTFQIISRIPADENDIRMEWVVMSGETIRITP